MAGNPELDALFSSIHPILQKAYGTGHKVGYNAGVLDGIEIGQLTGYVAGVNALTPAISDGLRHGSSECGKAMQGLKSMGAVADDDDDDDDDLAYSGEEIII